MAKNKLSFRDQVAGFPVGQIFVICCARISEPISFSSLFPYVYFLTRDFHIAKTEADISKYAGYLSSIFSFCSVVSAIQWSKFSQRRGRKLTIMIGLSGSVFSMLLLGFSVNYYMALAARGSIGLLNGNLPVLRTTIGEIATERRHQALAFSTFPLLWEVGCIFGPLIGALAHPRQNDDYYRKRPIQMPDVLISTETGRRLSASAQKYLTSSFPWLDRLNEKFPYALPNLIVATLLLYSIIILFFFMEETHYKLKYDYDFGLAMGDKLLVFLGIRDKNAKRPWQLKEDSEYQPLIRDQLEHHVDEDPFTYDNDDDDSSIAKDDDDDEEENENAIEDITSPNFGLLSEVSSINSDQQCVYQPKSYGATDDNSIRKSPHIVSRPSSTASEALRRQRSLSSKHSSSGAKTNIAPFSRRQSITLVKTLSRTSEIVRFEEGDDTKIPWKALRNPMCYGPILANVLLNIHVICFDQFMPIFLSNDVIYDDAGNLDSKFPFRISGGLGYSQKQVGRLLSITGFTGMFIILFVYPYVDRNFKSTTAFTNLHFSLMSVYLLAPFVIFALPQNFRHYAPDEPKSYVFTNLALYVVFFLRVLSTDMLYPLVTLLTHIGSPPRHRAIINSLSISASAAAKCLSPLIFGNIMAFTFSHSIIWLFFWSLALATAIGYFQSFQLVEDAEEETRAHHDESDEV